MSYQVHTTSNPHEWAVVRSDGIVMSVHRTLAAANKDAAMREEWEATAA